MIAETEAFLNWAWWREDVPRIPRRLVSAGGFSATLRRPGAAARVARWWAGALDRVAG